MKKLPISLAAVSLLCSMSNVVMAQTAVAPPQAPPPVAPAPAAAPAPAPPEAAAPAPAAPPLVWAPPPAAPSSPPPSGAPIELMSLNLMLEKGLISKAEYDSALHDMQESSGQHTAAQQSVVFGRWATTLYGFLEGDMILDSTRSLTEVAGGTLIARGGTSNGSNGRFTFGVRNTRLGIRMKAPEFYGVRTSAMLESDFLGNQPGIQTGPYPGTPLPSNPYTSEGAYFTNPTFRIRHAEFKIETPVIDVMFGQYWQLFGWGSAYQPNSVEIQGLPGEIYARTPQLRLSKALKADPVTLELAVAAVRPVQRDSGMPDGEGGLRFSVDSWTGTQTTGSTGTQTAPLSVAVTGLARRVEVNQFATSPKYTNELTMTALALDGFIPIVPGTKEKKDNSFSVQGEFATGYGYADMFSSTNFGLGFLVPPGAGFATTPTSVKATYFSPDIDPGIVAYDGLGHLHGVQLTSYVLGAQYYLPGVDGKLWISGNYSHQQSANSHDYAASSGAVDRTATLYAQDWFDFNLFIDPVPGVRVGLEYANTRDTYVDGIFSVNHRGQMSGFFIF